MCKKVINKSLLLRAQIIKVAMENGDDMMFGLDRVESAPFYSTENVAGSSSSTVLYKFDENIPVRLPHAFTCEKEQELSDEEEESSRSPGSDPFAPECKIPIPIPQSAYDFWLPPNFIRKRNERERQRVRNVNDGFERLRLHLPLGPKYRDKRLSKVETLKIAINYINHLQHILQTNEPLIFNPFLE